MKPNTIKLERWIAPEESGPKILTMPNIPYPLHNVAPRTILGRKVWDEMRKKCYADAKHKCEICGAEGKMHAHELYDIDYTTQTAIFKRCVCLCPKCHVKCIHTGRALTLYKKRSPLMTKEALLDGAEHAFKIIYEYNATHRSSEPLRVFSTWLDYMKEPDLKPYMEELIEKYEMAFYSVSQKWYDSKHWWKWSLVIGDKEYPTPYANKQEWEEAMAINNEKRKPEIKNPFTGGIYDEMDKILKEEL